MPSGKYSKMGQILKFPQIAPMFLFFANNISCLITFLDRNLLLPFDKAQNWQQKTQGPLTI
jgi:hypothetical protein